MKINELQLGDWVNYSILNIDAKVLSILGNHTIAIQFVDKGGTTSCIHGLIEESIRPIELTEDILVKNGFELGEKIGEVGVHIYRHTVYKMDNFSLEVYSDNTFHFASIKLNYVHQLQHLLRFCGIEKEITI